MKSLSFKEYVAVGVGLAVIGIVFFAGNGASFFATGKLGSDAQGAAASQTMPQEPSGNEVTVKDIVVGTGKEAVAGSNVLVHYTLTLADGTKVDSSYDRGQPLPVKLDPGQVIMGFEIGVKGMKEGGKRSVVIPPEMGYGSRPVGPIPANSVLNFDLELVQVQ